MHKMSNLEYSFMVRELQFLAGKHFSRIRKIRDGLYRMKIGSSEIICEPGVRMHITKYVEEAQPHDKFVEKLEKELKNAKLQSIEQINQDRIIAFNFGGLQLVFEMFGQGNIILAKDQKTITAYRFESWSDREIVPGKEYKYPRSSASALEASEKYIIVSLMKLPVGKEYALEALARLGIEEKTPGASLSGNQLMKLEETLRSIADNAQPLVYYSEKPVDYSLCRLSKYDYPAREFATLGEAADEYYNNFEEPDPQLEKLKVRLSKQEERLGLLQDEEKRYRECGDFIYANYQEIEQAIELARKDKIKTDKKEKSFEFQ
ncbi:NFACT family protein [Candidatus Micrarchaeota archaeon]|nr:NFACT family protein [Candidatus Micrarchaeota archaeon]